MASHRERHGPWCSCPDVRPADPSFGNHLACPCRLPGSLGLRLTFPCPHSAHTCLRFGSCCRRGDVQWRRGIGGDSRTVNRQVWRPVRRPGSRYVCGRRCPAQSLRGGHCWVWLVYTGTIGIASRSVPFHRHARLTPMLAPVLKPPIPSHARIATTPEAAGNVRHRIWAARSGPAEDHHDAPLRTAPAPTQALGCRFARPAVVINRLVLVQRRHRHRRSGIDRVRRCRSHGVCGRGQAQGRCRCADLDAAGGRGDRCTGCGGAWEHRQRVLLPQGVPALCGADPRRKARPPRDRSRDHRCPSVTPGCPSLGCCGAERAGARGQLGRRAGVVDHDHREQAAGG